MRRIGLCIPTDSPHLTPPAPGMIAIYSLVDPRTIEVRYIGKSVNPWPRYGSHRRAPLKDKSHCARWIRVLRGLGLYPFLRIVDWVEHDAWQQAERHYIALARQSGCRLTNEHDGGQGASARRVRQLVPCECGCGKVIWSVDPWSTARRYARGHQGRGKPMHPNSRAALTQAVKGKPRSPEFRAAVGAAHKGKTIGAETREKLSRALSGRPVGDEQRAHLQRLAEALRGKPITEEQREKRRLNPPGATLTPDNVRTIRRRFAAGESQAALARAYGVTRACIRDLLTGKTWGWITDPSPCHVPKQKRQPGDPPPPPRYQRRHGDEGWTRPDNAARNKAMVWTDEMRAKLSAANTGQTPSEETRARLSKARKGRSLSPETRAKIAEGQRRRWERSRSHPA